MYYYLCQISKLRVEIDWFEEKKKSDITILKKNVHYSLSEKVKPRWNENYQVTICLNKNNSFIIFFIFIKKSLILDMWLNFVMN